MFRDLMIVFLIFVGVSLQVSDPIQWRVVAISPPQVAQSIIFLQSISPFSSILCYCLSLALFMTRLKY